MITNLPQSQAIHRKSLELLVHAFDRGNFLNNIQNQVARDNENKWLLEVALNMQMTSGKNH